ncbi:MAG: hypothetical protein A2Y04_03690 [Omnitrophica WOR_2 bacterium GWC2_45_7]|nr:MAG: hypothetical protein A2Y04_03690 [Omnitrophica WOR_2 bacterium GWC2_45_7]
MKRGGIMGAETNNLNGTSNSDGRYFPRWQVQNRVLYQLENEAQMYEGSTKDLSCAGACLCVDKEIKLNQKINLTVYLSDKERVTLTGEVMWSKQENQYNQIGVIFFNTSSQAQDLILQHAFEINKEELMKHWYKDWFGPQ